MFAQQAWATTERRLNSETLPPELKIEGDEMTGGARTFKWV
jgi:hypothetical protein